MFFQNGKTREIISPDSKVKKFYPNGNSSKIIYPDGSEEEYNFYGKITYRKDKDGLEKWFEYDKNQALAYTKDSNGIEEWFDENKKLTKQKDKNGTTPHFDADENITYRKNSTKIEERFDEEEYFYEDSETKNFSSYNLSSNSFRFDGSYDYHHYRDETFGRFYSTPSYDDYGEDSGPDWWFIVIQN